MVEQTAVPYRGTSLIKKTPTTLGPPWNPTHRPTVLEGFVFFKVSNHCSERANKRHLN